MIHRFDRKTVQLVYDIEKLVAERLGVDNATLCIVTGLNADVDQDSHVELGLCFETEEDNTWALLNFERDTNEDLETLLTNFMTNSNVEWMKQGIELGSDDDEDGEWEFDDVPALTTDEIKALREIIKERNA